MKKFLQRLVYDGGRDLPEYFAFLVEREADSLAVSEEGSFELFEEFAFENYSNGRQPRLYASEEYRDQVADSGVIHEDAVDFFHYRVPGGQLNKVLAGGRPGERTVMFADRDYLEEMREALPETVRDEITGIYR